MHHVQEVVGSRLHLHYALRTMHCALVVVMYKRWWEVAHTYYTPSTRIQCIQESYLHLLFAMQLSIAPFFFKSKVVDGNFYYDII